MKIKCLIAVLCLLLSVTTGASAHLASLDEVLSPLLSGRGAVSMSISMNLKTLMPFDETRLIMINRVLWHARLDAQLDLSAETQNTGFKLLLGEHILMEITEQCRDGAYLLQSSLLKNRMLFSTQRSPMDSLLLSSAEEAVEPETTSGLNTSDVEEAFDMLAATQELEGFYRTLIDKTIPLTEENSTNYTIEDIGKGRISYVARLTTQQSSELLDEICTVLSCGMDAEYSAELSMATFANGFVVALYQNADREDICVYIKGTVIYPDGDKRTLKWQWAFTPDRGTQTFAYEAARERGTRDSRVINAILEHKEKENTFTLEGKSVTNLRRGTVNETSTFTMDLTGDSGDLFTCMGSVERVTEGTSGGESMNKMETSVTVDLSLIGTEDGSELSGTATYLQKKKDIVWTELELTFSPTVAAAYAAEGSTDTQASAPPVVIAIIPADPTTVQQSAEKLTITAEETQNTQLEFLVGAPPLGLYDYEIPGEIITISMDQTEPKVLKSLMNEAMQRLAGNLVLAMLDLPAEDRALLSDGMTEEDYAIFLAMLD